MDQLTENSVKLALVDLVHFIQSPNQEIARIRFDAFKSAVEELVGYKIQELSHESQQQSASAENSSISQ
jgi:hypothetical protein